MLVIMEAKACIHQDKSLAGLDQQAGRAQAPTRVPG